MDLATGAMASLLPKLVKLLNDEYNLQKGVKKDVQFLERELRSMQAALHKVGEMPRDQLDELVRIWADEVRELSYDMEDVVDGFLVRVEDSEPADNPHKLKRLMEKMGNLFKKGRSRHQITDAIKGIKDQIREVADRRDRYKINDLVANPASTTTIDPRILAMYKDQKEIVGIDGVRDELIQMLEDGNGGVYNKQLMILSIFGFGGLGKSTLAKAVYDTIKDQFDCRAFITVGRSPDVKGVFKDIIFQLDKKMFTEFSASTLSEMQLIDLLRELLNNKRYIIIIDDIWDIKSWELIKCVLMDSDRGSRIVTTTRIFQVATKADNVYKLKPLPQNRSEELFYKRLFGDKDKCPYDQPTEVAENILHKCGGVPLAIITIASLLAGKPIEDWSRVYKSIGFGYEDNEHVENTRKILLFSYYDLPCYLRTCLLYLSIYPEDGTIMKDTLIWKWIAEGFVHEEPGIDLSELGERYFNELINRSMIQPVEEKCIVYACQVHDLVLDMIYSLAEEENFVTVLNGTPKQHTSLQRNPRRLVIQKRVIDQDDPMGNISTPQIRSFNAIKCHFSEMPILSGFQVLRALAIDECTCQTSLLKYIGGLVHLRYLEISRTYITDLPGGIEDLHFLQTLILRHTSIEVLPQSVGLLKKLKCLSTDTGLVEVTGWIGSLTSLEVLSLKLVSPLFVKELGKLTELRELRFKLAVADDLLIKYLVESLGHLKKLIVLEFVGGRGNCSGLVDWEDFVPSRKLRHLKFHIYLRKLPAWINPTLLPNLYILDVPSLSLEVCDVEILGRFRELIDIRFIAVVSEVMGGGAFPKLRRLEMSSNPRFTNGAMPSLEILDLRIPVVGWMKMKLKFDFSGWLNLPCLHTVRVRIITENATVKDCTKLMLALKHAVNIHPNRPILSIDWDACFILIRARNRPTFEEDEEDNEIFHDIRDHVPRLTRRASCVTYEEDRKEEHYGRLRRLPRRSSCMF